MLVCYEKPVPDKPCKFVKVDGKYRFFLKNSWDTHRDAIRPEETAEAAGILIEFVDHWIMIDNHSTSLSVTCAEKHHRELDALLGKPEHLE